MGPVKREDTATLRKGEEATKRRPFDVSAKHTLQEEGSQLCGRVT